MYISFFRLISTSFRFKNCTFLNLDLAKSFTCIKSAPINNFDTKTPLGFKHSEENSITSAHN